jgi:hypothetical protein
MAATVDVAMDECRTAKVKSVVDIGVACGRRWRDLKRLRRASLS